MAITDLTVLNPGDKTRHYTYASGNGTPAAGDALVDDVVTYTAGSQYLDLAAGTLYVRTAVTVPPAVGDWKAI